MICVNLESGLTPAAFLASEEALLDAAESGGPEVLCFWESARPFIVVGFGQSVEREVDLPACRAANVPIVRRHSGGGAVVQGPGCLNYALILRQDTHPALATVGESNRWIMERNRRALQSVLGDAAIASVRGHTDLALGGADGIERKVSGNAQRRRKSALLFHGTLLHSLESLGGESRLNLLHFPSLQPEYRGSRAHTDFVSTIPSTAPDLTDAWKQEWEALAPGCPPDPASVEALMASRYTLDSWNFRR